MATRLGLKTEFLAWQGADDGLPQAPSWRRGVQADLIEERLRQDTERTHQGGLRGAQRNLDRRHLRHRRGAPGHRRRRPPGAADGRHHLGPGQRRLPARRMGRRRHDQRLAEGPDAAAGHQLQRAVAAALEASKTAKLPRSFWAWDEIVEMNKDGYWPYTPNTNLLYGLSEALDMLLGEGLDQVFARHQRWAAGVRAAVDAWGLPIQCADPAVYSPVLTGVITPAGRRCRRAAPPDPRALRPLARHRPGQAQGPHVPHRPPRRQQRPDADGDAGRLRDGPEARRRQARRQRRAGGDGLLRQPRRAAGRCARAA